MTIDITPRQLLLVLAGLVGGSAAGGVLLGQRLATPRGREIPTVRLDPVPADIPDGPPAAAHAETKMRARAHMALTVAQIFHLPQLQQSWPRAAGGAEADTLLNTAMETRWPSRDDAIRAYGRAIEANPNCREAFERRGCTYSWNRDYPRAIADYTEAIRLGCRGLYLRRGDLHMRLGEVEEAIADYTEAINGSEGGSWDQYNAYTRRGIAYAMRWNQQTSFDDFLRASKIESVLKRK